MFIFSNRIRCMLVVEIEQLKEKLAIATKRLKELQIVPYRVIADTNQFLTMEKELERDCRQRKADALEKLNRLKTDQAALLR